MLMSFCTLSSSLALSSVTLDPRGFKNLAGLRYHFFQTNITYERQPIITL